MKYKGKDHTFVICAYKDNPHLEEMILSVKNQSVKSRVILSTSTPSKYIKDVCDKHNVTMYVNPNPKGAGGDWNYGYMRAKTDLVTVAHQDDVYDPDFLLHVLRVMNQRDDVIISFTDYSELRRGKRVDWNVLLSVKRILNFPLRFPCFYKSKFIRRRILSFGCPICCPAVTFVRRKVGDYPFNTTFKDSCDYKTWVDLAELDGSFVYIPKKLLSHRIYEESATTLNLSNNIRKNENLEIMSHYWPRPIARMINGIYVLSEKSNQLK